MRGDQITSHDVGQEEGETLEAGEVGKTTYMVYQSLQPIHTFMMCGQMMMWCNGSWPEGLHSLPFINSFATVL